MDIWYRADRHQLQYGFYMAAQRWLFSDLFGAFGEETLSRIPSVQRKALEIALLRSERGEPGDDSVDARTVYAGVLSVLQELGSTTPVLVAVDDIAVLDRATASALSFALRRLEGSSAVLLASIREDDTRARALIGAVADDRNAEVLLRPMAPSSVRRILDTRFSDRMSRHTTTRVAAACGGNSFYAIETAHELLRQCQRVGPGPLPVPGELRQLLTARVNRLPARARDSLLAASCLGDAHTNVVGASGLRQAEDAGLITIDPDGRARFTHPLLAAAVYESASPGRRRSVHRMLADRLEDAEEPRSPPGPRSRRAHEALELPFERARCVLEIGRVQRRRKQKRLAREALLEAAQTFALLGTPLWAARAEAELERVNVRRAPSGLTPTEKDIAMLAAEGLSNRAIAQRSFVSVKTVEANLGRVYRKLGITSRPQLVHALDQLMRAGS